MIRHEYKGVLRRHWEFPSTIADGVARVAQFESGDGWDLVSFVVVPTSDNDLHVHMVFRRAPNEGEVK